MYNYKSSTKKKKNGTQVYKGIQQNIKTHCERVDRRQEKISKEVKFELKYGKVWLTKKRRQYKCLVISLLQNVMANIWWHILPVVLLSIYKHVCVYMYVFMCN